MILGIVALLQPLKLRSQTLKLDLPMRTLRHYDEIGLVEASGRTEGGFRLYTEGAFDRLMLIRRMKPLGFSLAEMAELLRVIDSGEADAGDVPATEEVLDSFIAQAQEQREALRVQQGMADEFLELLQCRRPAGC